MKIEFSVNCCCDNRFIKIYRTLMKDVRKQLGKKRFQDIQMSCNESSFQQIFNNGYYAWKNNDVCIDCCRHYHHKFLKHISAYITVKKYDIKIEA